MGKGLGKAALVGDQHLTGCHKLHQSVTNQKRQEKVMSGAREGGDKIPDRPFKLHLGHGGCVTESAPHDARFTPRWLVGRGAEEGEGNKVKL